MNQEKKRLHVWHTPFCSPYYRDKDNNVCYSVELSKMRIAEKSREKALAEAVGSNIEKISERNVKNGLKLWC